MNTSIKAHVLPTKPVFYPGMSIAAADQVFERTLSRSEIPDARPRDFWHDPDSPEDRYLIMSVEDDVVTAVFLGKLPCEIPWCEGHPHQEAAEYSQLHHAGPMVEFSSDRGPWQLESYLSTAQMIDNEHGRYLYIEIAALGAATFEETKQIIEDLRSALVSLERFAAEAQAV